MIISMANISINQISIELRSCTTLMVPWMKHGSTINLCRSYQSLCPIAYANKNFSQSNEEKCSLHMKSSMEKAIVHSSNSQDRRVMNRISNFGRSSPNQFPCAMRIADSGTVAIPGKPYIRKIQVNSRDIAGDISESSGSENATSDGLDVSDCDLIKEFEPLSTDSGQISHEIITCETETTCTSKTRQDAENMAIEALATRAFTAAELRKKLCGKKFSIDIVEAVLTDFQARGLLNDYLYAESFSSSRWQSRSWGPRRVKQALLQKGVSEAAVEKAMKQVYEDGGSADQDSSRFGLSKTSMDLLFANASKQWQRGRDATLEKRKTRIARWLQYRGFNWGVVMFILKKLESQYPP